MVYSTALCEIEKGVSEKAWYPYPTNRSVGVPVDPILDRVPIFTRPFRAFYFEPDLVLFNDRKGRFVFGVQECHITRAHSTLADCCLDQPFPESLRHESKLTVI